jgi:gluconate 2-dehydrogenase gamma chain
MLTPLENQTLAAALDRIIPADEFPSACEAGVLDYLARQFQTDLAGMLPAYRIGLADLEQVSQMRFGMGFANLTPARQDSVLSTPDLISFVDMLAAHAAEGYYGDPGNGGNRDGIAWRMIGFEVRG